MGHTSTMHSLHLEAALLFSLRTKKSTLHRYVSRFVGSVVGSFVSVTFGNLDAHLSIRAAALTAVPGILMVVPGSVAYRGFVPVIPPPLFWWLKTFPCAKFSSVALFSFCHLVF